MKLQIFFWCLITYLHMDQGVLGIEVTPNEFPFVVDIQILGRHWCVGSIISSEWILTSAHCVCGEPSYYYLTAGDHNLSLLEKTEQTRGISRFIKHPNYGIPTAYENDISLMMVEPPFEFNEYVSAAKLPETDFTPTPVATLVGWGSLSTVLTKLDLPHIPDTACNTSYGGNVEKSMVCYGEFGRGACQGDTGSPLLCGDENNLCGIATQARGCYRPGYLGVNAETSYYTEWIRSVTTIYPEDPQAAVTINTCGGLVNSSSAVINLETGSGPGQRCAWVVQGFLDMSRFRLNSGLGNGSQVFITQYNVSNSTLGAQTEIKNVSEDYFVSGDMFLVTLIVGSSSFEGLILEYYSSGYRLPQTSLIGFEYLSNSNGSYTYPRSGDYRNGENALFVLNPPQPENRILKFSSLELENGPDCPYDAISVYTWNSDSYNQDARFCGITPPDAFNVPGGLALVTFSTGASVTRNGFTFNWE